jgi:hypothetical protein
MYHRMVAGSMICVEKEFNLVPHKYEEYKGLRFRDGDCDLVVDVWLYQVDEDTSGLVSHFPPRFSPSFIVL